MKTIRELCKLFLGRLLLVLLFTYCFYRCRWPRISSSMYRQTSLVMCQFVHFCLNCCSAMRPRRAFIIQSSIEASIGALEWCIVRWQGQGVVRTLTLRLCDAFPIGATNKSMCCLTVHTRPYLTSVRQRQNICARVGIKSVVGQHNHELIKKNLQQMKRGHYVLKTSLCALGSRGPSVISAYRASLNSVNLS